MKYLKRYNENNENLNYKEEIFNMINNILPFEDYPEYTSKVIDIDNLRFKINFDSLEEYGYEMEIGKISNDWGYSVDVGKNIEDSEYYLYYRSDGFYDLTEELGYEEDEDDKLIYDYLKKYTDSH